MASDRSLVRLIREPLVWFLVVGGVLFFTYRALAPAPRDTIVVTRETAAALIQQYEILTGVAADAAQRETVIQGHIDDEVLLKEAFRRGYHETDFRTRKRLLSVMRTTLTQVQPAPSRAQLEAFYRSNQRKYDVGEVVTFDQVRFGPTSEKMPADPDAVRAALIAGTDFTTMGDRGMSFPMPTLTDQSRSRIVADFGPDVYEALASLPYGTWSQPLNTRGALVFVRVKERRDLTPPTFDEIEKYVSQDYDYTMTRAAQAARVAELRAKYRIEIEELEAE